MKNRWRTVEITAWTASVVLLSAYAGTRYWIAQAHQEGLAAFETARTAYAASEPGLSAHRSAPSAPPPDAVDTSSWSKARVAAYRRDAARGAAPEAVLRAPRLALVVPVFSDTSELNLNRGAGLIRGTAGIGEEGNLGVAAHRDGFFRPLKNVRIGDALYLEELGATHIYKVVSTRIVEPEDISVLRPTPLPTITLVTCYPFYFVGNAPQRFIVQAERVGVE